MACGYNLQNFSLFLKIQAFGAVALWNENFLLIFLLLVGLGFLQTIKMKYKYIRFGKCLQGKANFCALLTFPDLTLSHDLSLIFLNYFSALFAFKLFLIFSPSILVVSGNKLVQKCSYLCHLSTNYMPISLLWKFSFPPFFSIINYTGWKSRRTLILILKSVIIYHSIKSVQSDLSHNLSLALSFYS